MITVLVAFTAPGTQALIRTYPPGREISARSGCTFSSKTRTPSSRSA